MTLREMREAAGLRRVDVVSKLYAAPSTVYNWETGNAVISSYYAKALARLYKRTEKEIQEASREECERRKETSDYR